MVNDTISRERIGWRKKILEDEDLGNHGQEKGIREEYINGGDEGID